MQVNPHKPRCSIHHNGQKDILDSRLQIHIVGIRRLPNPQSTIDNLQSHLFVV
jgi:hypothetical protein